MPHRSSEPSASSLPDIRHPRFPSSATGACSTCGYEPVAYGASVCPHCGASDPNPGIARRYAGRGVFLGLFLFSLAGGLWGLCDPELGGTSGFFAGAGMLAVPGMVVGFAGGLLAGIAARVAGQR